jgi:hypothetical protein
MDGDRHGPEPVRPARYAYLDTTGTFLRGDLACGCSESTVEGALDRWTVRASTEEHDRRRKAIDWEL